MNEHYLTLFDKIDFNKIIDHPNILIAAAFWDEDRYLAAKTCYRYMRAIDDLIDCHKSVHKTIEESEKKTWPRLDGKENFTSTGTIETRGGTLVGRGFAKMARICRMNAHPYVLSFRPVNAGA